MLATTEAFRFRGLTYYDAGARSYYTVEAPVRTPEDLEGLKIRVQESPTSMRMVRAMGGSPTPISWGELYTALQQGVVDGAENNPPSYFLSRHYEVAPYFVLNEHTAVPDVLVVGTPIWDGLSDQEKRWLQDAAEASAELEEALWRASTAEALQAVTEAGAEVIEMSGADRAPFSSRVAAMLTDVEPATRALIERIQAVGAAPPASADSSEVPS
jgi:TRAP-type C4-dicarboxylate transport system substrate-binding protein